MNIAHRLMDQARITPVSQPNRIHTVVKCEDGGLQVTLNSGKTFKVSKDDEMIQAFLIYTVLAEV